MAGSPTLSPVEMRRIVDAGVTDVGEARRLVRLLRRLIHSDANQRALEEVVKERGPMRFARQVSR